MCNNHKCHLQCIDLRVDVFCESVTAVRKKIIRNHIRRGTIVNRKAWEFREGQASSEVFQKNYGYQNMGRG